MEHGEAQQPWAVAYEGLTTLGPEQQLLKAEQVARVMGLGRTKVYELIAAGLLPVVRIGTAVRVPLAGLREWISINTTSAPK